MENNVFNLPEVSDSSPELSAGADMHLVTFSSTEFSVFSGVSSVTKCSEFEN